MTEFWHNNISKQGLKWVAMPFLGLPLLQSAEFDQDKGPTRNAEKPPHNWKRPTFFLQEAMHFYHSHYLKITPEPPSARNYRIDQPSLTILCIYVCPFCHILVTWRLITNASADPKIILRTTSAIQLQDLRASWQQLYRYLSINVTTTRTALSRTYTSANAADTAKCYCRTLNFGCP